MTGGDTDLPHHWGEKKGRRGAERGAVQTSPLTGHRVKQALAGRVEKHLPQREARAPVTRGASMWLSPASNAHQG